MACGIYFAEPDTIQVFTIFYELFRGGTHLAMPKTICAPDSSSLKPGSGATEGVLDEGVLGCPACYPWVGLMGCEDTKTEDYIRVRIGLYLAWKASLAIQILCFLPCNRLHVNPRSLRCLYKLKGIVRKGHHIYSIPYPHRLDF